MSLKDIKGELALHLRLDRYLYADAAKERDTLINLVSKAVGVHEPVKEELKDFIKESYDYKTSYTTSRPPSSSTAARWGNKSSNHRKP